jgi:Ca-activated chloride channel homolog
MPEPIPMEQIALWAALATAALAILGEWLHGRRIQRIGRLAFGPTGRPRAWTRAVPPVRIAALAALAWSLVTLISYNQRTRDREASRQAPRHLMVLIDVSPSMLLADAGDGTRTRMTRASAVLKSILDRLPGDSIRYSAAGFYTEARMLVRECRDRELLLHLVGGVPFHITYRPGKTNLLASINQTAAFMKDWPRKSATLLILTDGATVPHSGLERMPSSVGRVIVAGVGDPSRGTFIDGQLSRQDSAGLAQLARRLGGSYYESNSRHIPDEALRTLLENQESNSKWRADRRLIALGLLALSSLLLCLAPILLDFLGSRWRPRPAAASPPSS